MARKYWNDEVARAVGGKPTVDRFVRGIGPTWERVVSLYMMTTPTGDIVGCLSLDTVDTTGKPIHTAPLGLYPVGNPQQPLDDAKQAARDLNLALRQATPGGGWVTRLDPDNVMTLVGKDGLPLEP